MRIDQLLIQNFKKFESQTFDLNSQFTLFVGDNGAGKTTVLDALAIAAGVWLVEPPDSTLVNSRREISPIEVRLEAEVRGDRTQLREQRPVRIQATGKIAEQEKISWVRQVRAAGKRTSNAEARKALELIKDMYARDAAGDDVLCPVLAYYGAGRAWLPSNRRVPKLHKNGPARRWAAFYDCFNERIRFDELQRWFSRETTERGNRKGRWRPGFLAVRHAILRCLPGADDVWFDSDRDQIVLTINGNTQPFDNLSAGQRMMLALVADLAIKAVTQNAFLLPPGDLESGDQSRVLEQTPGLVLIDELDVHLHPKWQRRVAQDLKDTFPGLQFVCTSHSPQVIGELKPEEIRSLDDGIVSTPPRSFGIDSNRVLEELMDAPARNDSVNRMLEQLFESLDSEDFSKARNILQVVERRMGPDDPELTRARALMAFLEPTA